jgi:sulfatase modifying factor 1
MTMPNITHLVAAVGLALPCVSGAQSNTVIKTVHVGNPGNTGEWSGGSYGGDGPNAFVGAVDYVYNIGKYEVTAGQYRDFLNAVDPMGSNPYGIYTPAMNNDDIYGCQITWNAGSSTYDFSGRPSGTEADWADRPVNYVSWADAARFANWLHNGQPTGTLTGDPTQDAWLTEDGSYDLNGATTAAAVMLITREPDATWVIPSEDEWHKAAYHKNDGDTGNYFDYPTSSDRMPSNVLDGGGNNATFYIDIDDYTIGAPYYRTECGAHVNSESPYGTFDQGGNVWEWNEATVDGSYRSLRGGSYKHSGDFLHASDRHLFTGPRSEWGPVGFRVAEVPEPATLSLLVLGGLGALERRRRRTG